MEKMYYIYFTKKKKSNDLNVKSNEYLYSLKYSNFIFSFTEIPAPSTTSTTPPPYHVTTSMKKNGN